MGCNAGCRGPQNPARVLDDHRSYRAERSAWSQGRRAPTATAASPEPPRAGGAHGRRHRLACRSPVGRRDRLEPEPGADPVRELEAQPRRDARRWTRTHRAPRCHCRAPLGRSPSGSALREERRTKASRRRSSSCAPGARSTPLLSAARSYRVLLRVPSARPHGRWSCRGNGKGGLAAALCKSAIFGGTARIRTGE